MRKQFRRDGKQKHIFAVLVAFVMVFFLAACGKDAPGEAAEVSSGASALSGDRITLTEDGGDTITFERTGDFPQEDEDSAKTLELAEDEPVTEMEGDEEETAYQHYWNGGWYGWSGFTNGTGLYSDVDGVYCDCMARIWIDADGRGTLVLWDEGTDLSWPLADVDVSVSDSGYDMGKMKSMSGRYLDMALGIADWLIAPDDLGYENLICIEGTYTDPTDTFSTYDYQFFLRPWGLDWSDIEADYPGGVPYYYETWYLPAIEAGIPMPDAIGGGDFLAPGEVPEEEMEAQEG